MPQVPIEEQADQPSFYKVWLSRFSTLGEYVQSIANTKHPWIPGSEAQLIREIASALLGYEGSPPTVEQWAVKDHGVLHAPGFKIVGSQAEAVQWCDNQGSESDPAWYGVPAVRTVVEIDGREFYSGWTLRPTEEQQRLSGWPAEKEYQG